MSDVPTAPAPINPNAASTLDGLVATLLGSAGVFTTTQSHDAAHYLVAGGLILVSALWNWANATHRIPAPMVFLVTTLAKSMTHG